MPTTDDSMDAATAESLGSADTFTDLPRDVQEQVINAAIQAGYRDNERRRRIR
jgi:hypothetical protein